METHWRLLERLPNVNVVFGESLSAIPPLGSIAIAKAIARIVRKRLQHIFNFIF